MDKLWSAQKNMFRTFHRWTGYLVTKYQDWAWKGSKGSIFFYQQWWGQVHHFLNFWMHNCKEFRDFTIYKRFRESRDMFACKGQGLKKHWMPMSFDPFGITNQHCIKDITRYSGWTCRLAYRRKVDYWPHSGGLHCLSALLVLNMTSIIFPTFSVHLNIQVCHHQHHYFGQCPGSRSLAPECNASTPF